MADERRNDTVSNDEPTDEEWEAWMAREDFEVRCMLWSIAGVIVVTLLLSLLEWTP